MNQQPLDSTREPTAPRVPTGTSSREPTALDLHTLCEPTAPLKYPREPTAPRVPKTTLLLLFRVECLRPIMQSEKLKINIFAISVFGVSLELSHP